jgi:hypothetical protein
MDMNTTNMLMQRRTRMDSSLPHALEPRHAVAAEIVMLCACQRVTADATPFDILREVTNGVEQIAISWDVTATSVTGRA